VPEQPLRRHELFRHAPLTGTIAIVSPVAGLITGMVLAASAAHHFPLM
jgi:hypothetical protein